MCRKWPQYCPIWIILLQRWEHLASRWNCVDERLSRWSLQRMSLKLGWRWGGRHCPRCPRGTQRIGVVKQWTREVKDEKYGLLWRLGWLGKQRSLGLTGPRWSYLNTLTEKVALEMVLYCLLGIKQTKNLWDVSLGVSNLYRSEPASPKCPEWN